MAAKANNHLAGALVEELQETHEMGTKGMRSLAERARKALVDLQDETEKRMKDLMNRGETYGKESFQTIQDRIAPAVRLSEKVLTRAKENAEWIQDKVEEAVSAALAKLHLPTTADLGKLVETVESLGKKVEALGKVSDLQDQADETAGELQALRGEVKTLRKTVDGLSKNLGLLERRVRPTTPAPAKKAAKPKTTKG